MCTLICYVTEAVPQECFYKKLFAKYAANLQENNRAKV